MPLTLISECLSCLTVCNSGRVSFSRPRRAQRSVGSPAVLNHVLFVLAGFLGLPTCSENSLLLREFHASGIFSAACTGANRLTPSQSMKLTRLATTSLPRLLRPQTTSSATTLRRTMATNGYVNGVKQTGARTNLVSFATRLKDGRALAQDVWSIFKCASDAGSVAEPPR